MDQLAREPEGSPPDVVLVRATGGARAILGGRGPGYALLIGSRPAALELLTFDLLPSGGNGIYAWEGRITPGVVAPSFDGGWRRATRQDHLPA